jgi:Mg-chelatase subunit ChlD
MKIKTKKTTVLNKIGAWKAKLLHDVSGSVAPTGAIAILALLIPVGVAIDWSSMVTERTNLQSYSDAAVLAAAVSGETELEVLQQIAETSVKAQSGRDLIVTARFVGDDLQVDVDSLYEPLLMGSFGHAEKGVAAKSRAPLQGALGLNLALVLDTTGSMEGSRMTALKQASSELLNTIGQSTSASSNVHVSVVPFADYVRIDPALRGATWLHTQADREATWDRLDGNASTGCRTEGSGETASTVCDNPVYETMTATVSWIGCMGSRRDGYHTTPRYGTRQLQGFAGNTHCDGQYNIMQPLSSNLAEVDQTIQDLEPRGRTFMPAGLMWGWRTLDRGLPFDEINQTDAEDTQDVLLLMSDGANTVSLREPVDTHGFTEGLYHWGVADTEENQRSADNQTRQACADIKRANIKIISIAFEISDAQTLTLMRNCASSPADFYDAQSSAQLGEAFQKIGSGFNTVRLTR